MNGGHQGVRGLNGKEIRVVGWKRLTYEKTQRSFLALTLAPAKRKEKGGKTAKPTETVALAVDAAGPQGDTWGVGKEKVFC